MLYFLLRKIMCLQTFPKGLTIYGNFTAIVLTSGACIAYFGTSDNTVTTT